jgi:hypothetical protein
LGFRTRLVIDIAAFLAYLAATNTPLTGIYIHEWLGVALAVLLALHAAINWDWTMRAFRYFINKLRNLSRINLVVDLLVFTLLAAVMLSGFLVSRYVLPLLGLPVPSGPTWRILHSLTAKLLLLAIGLHIGLHWRWFVDATKKWFALRRTAKIESTQAKG